MVQSIPVNAQALKAMLPSSLNIKAATDPFQKNDKKTNVLSSIGKTQAASKFQQEAQAAQNFAAMFIDEVLQETMPNMFGHVAGAQSYQSLFMQYLSKDFAQSDNGMGLLPLLEKSLHIPASAVQSLENHATVLFSSLLSHSSTEGVPEPIGKNAQAFIQKLTPLVKQAGQDLGIAPRLIMAQIALETGWGRSVVGNNLFGIKATPGAPSVLAATHEANSAGQLLPTTAAFRAFPSLADCLEHYVQLLKNNYSGVLNVGNNAQAFAQGLVQGHYATDPRYAEKIIAMAQSPALESLP